MVVPIYDQRDAYGSRAWSQWDDSDDGRRGYSSSSDRRGDYDSDHDDPRRHEGRSAGYDRSEPRHGYRPQDYHDQDDRRQQAPSRRYDDGYSEPDESDATAPHRAHRRDVSHSRPVGQANSGASHGYTPSSHGQQHGSSASTQPGSSGFFANMMGAAASHAMQHAGSRGQAQHGYAPSMMGAAMHYAQSQNGHAPSMMGAAADQAIQYAQSQQGQHGHAPSHGAAHSMMGAAANQASQYAQSQQGQSQHGHAPSHGVALSDSHGGQQDRPDLFRDMHLPPATRALLNFAQDKGLLDDLGKYFKVLPPSRDFKYSKCTGRKRAVCVSIFRARYGSILAVNAWLSKLSIAQVGINYVGQKDELKGCANDARNMREFLIRAWPHLQMIRTYSFPNNTHITYHSLTGNYGFKSENILLLVDDDHSRGRERPTRDEMFNAMAWLIKDAGAHDSLFFHCQSLV